MPDVDTRHYVPSEIRLGLANIVIEWSKIEAYLAEFLSWLLTADQGAMYVLNQDVSSSTQLNWIRTLADHGFTNENTRENLYDLFLRIDAARIDRNGYVHGLWSEGPAGEAAHTA
jgi:hypothetical protein